MSTSSSKFTRGVFPPWGRPIMSANGCHTENISTLVDSFLNPASVHHKSYVKDTFHFILIMNELDQLPENCISVTYNVTSLYTNIPNQGGLLAVRKTLQQSRSSGVKPSNDTLIQLFGFVLTKKTNSSSMQIISYKMGAALWGLAFL